MLVDRRACSRLAGGQEVVDAARQVREEVVEADAFTYRRIACGGLAAQSAALSAAPAVSRPIPAASA